MVALFAAEASTATGLLRTAQSTFLLTNSPPGSEYFMLAFCPFGPFKLVRVCIDGLAAVINDAGDSWREIEVQRNFLEGRRVRK